MCPTKFALRQSQVTEKGLIRFVGGNFVKSHTTQQFMNSNYFYLEIPFFIRFFILFCEIGRFHEIFSLNHLGSDLT